MKDPLPNITFTQAIIGFCISLFAFVVLMVGFLEGW